MGLLDLPPEIIDDIITIALGPTGFESFVLSCKPVFARAALQIDRHNALKRQANYAAMRSSDRGKAMRVLYELSRDPLLSQYIEVLNLGSATDESEEIDTLDFDEFRMEQDAMENIKKVATEAEYLEKAGVDVEEWWETMMREDEALDEEEEDEGPPCIVITLLGQLPQLRLLQLPYSWRHFRPFEEANDLDKQLTYVLDALVDYSNRGQGENRPLGKLEIIFPFMPGGYEERAGLQSLEPLLPLKSLTEVYAVSAVAVHDQITGTPLKWRLPNLQSPLRRLELAYCCIDADGLSALVTYTPQLQIFKYSHETKRHGCEHDWNAGAFVEALSRHCGTTIVDLAITIDDLAGEIVNGASTFLSFPRLERLEVDVRVFCGPPIESGQRRGQNPKSPPPGEKVWTDADIPCVGSMLPESIVDVEVNTDYPMPDRRALHALLKNVREQREERLHKLREMVIRQFNESTAQDLVEEAGITLAIWGVEDIGRPRSMMPSWKREFEDRVGGIELR